MQRGAWRLAAAAAAMTGWAAIPALAAAPGAAPAPAGGAKGGVGVVNLDKAVAECAPGKALLAPWRKFEQTKIGEFRVRGEEAQKIEGRLQPGPGGAAAGLKADEKKALEDRKGVLEKEMAAIRAEYEAESTKFDAAMDELKSQAEAKLKTLAKQRGVSVLFDISPQAQPQQQIPGLPPPPTPKAPIVVDPEADLTAALIAALADVKIELKAPSKDNPLPAEDSPLVALETSAGRIVVQLDLKRAPVSVENFLKYVDDKHYDGLIFHRVINKFMIQGGGFDDKFAERKTRESIRNEADNGLRNLRGTLAMARTRDPDSASAQFYINHVDNEGLDHKGRNPAQFGYAVFGRVIEGIAVVDKIAGVETGTAANGFKDVPKAAVTITSARRIEMKDVKPDPAPKAPDAEGKAEPQAESKKAG